MNHSENNLKILWILFLSNLANIFAESLIIKENENNLIFQNDVHNFWTEEAFAESVTKNISSEGNDSLEVYVELLLDGYTFPNYSTYMQDIIDITTYNFMDMYPMVSLLTYKEELEKKSEETSSNEKEHQRHLLICLGILCNLLIVNVVVRLISGDPNISDALLECLHFIIS